MIAEAMRVAVRPAGDGRFEVVRDGEAVGAIACREEDGCLTFVSLEVEPGLRGLDLEAEAVWRVEAEAAARGVMRFRAVVPHEDGLGLYFWLRLGYRPIESKVGRAVMAREHPGDGGGP